MQKNYKKHCVFSLKMAAVRHLRFGMTSYWTTHDLHLMPILGSFGGYDGVPLELGRGARG